MRQALGGMLWTKQYFYYDLDLWLDEHGAGAHLPAHERRRCATASGLTCTTTTSSRCRTNGNTRGTRPGTSRSTRLRCGMVDPDFAKQQLTLMLRNDYLHPNGQMPAYEWNFGDVNPPVHAWPPCSSICSTKSERRQGRHRVPQVRLCQAVDQLHLVGEPQGSRRRQRVRRRLSRASTTSGSSTAPRRCPPAAIWTRRTARRGWCSSASTCCVLRSSSHCMTARTKSSSRSFSDTPCGSPAPWIAWANNNDEMWDEEDGFFYDVLRLPDCSARRLKVRSMVGLLPLAAVAVFEEDILAKLPKFRERAQRVQWPASRARCQHAPARAARRGEPSHALDPR